MNFSEHKEEFLYDSGNGQSVVGCMASTALRRPGLHHQRGQLQGHQRSGPSMEELLDIPQVGSSHWLWERYGLAQGWSVHSFLISVIMVSGLLGPWRVVNLTPTKGRPMRTLQAPSLEAHLCHSPEPC